MTGFSRRGVLLGLAASSLAGRALAVEPTKAMTVRMYKDASCGCCGGWADHMRKAGFTVESIDAPDMEAVKKRYKVPENLYSCHTALIGNFVVEGHVPAAAVLRMLKGEAVILGLSAAGMPVGSPGMETPDGDQEIYEITAFGDKSGQYRFARFRGDQEV